MVRQKEEDERGKMDSQIVAGCYLRLVSNQPAAPCRSRDADDNRLFIVRPTGPTQLWFTAQHHNLLFLLWVMKLLLFDRTGFLLLVGGKLSGATDQWDL